MNPVVEHQREFMRHDSSFLGFLIKDQDPGWPWDGGDEAAKGSAWDTEQFLLHDPFLKGINGSVCSPRIDYSFPTQGNEPCARKSLQGGSEHPLPCRSSVQSDPGASLGSRKIQSSPVDGTPGSLTIPGM